MMKWPPWPPISTKKFEVVIVVGRLEGLDKTQFEGERRALVEVKWKGQKGNSLWFLRRSVKRNFTKEGGIRDDGVVELQEEFRSFCSFSGYNEGMFYPWELSFTVFNVSLSAFQFILFLFWLLSRFFGSGRKFFCTSVVSFFLFSF